MLARVLTRRCYQLIRTKEVRNRLPGHHEGVCVRNLARYTGKAVPPSPAVFSSEVGGRSVYIKDTQARMEYGLTDQDLEGIPFKSLRNAYEYEENISLVRHERRLYPRALVVKRALSKHKTRLNMRKQIMKYRPDKENEEEDDITDAMKNLVRILNSESKSIKGGVRTSWHANQDHKRTQLSSSLKVVGLSIGTNVVVAGAKFGSFLFTGSASMLSEAVHSVIDTMNQLFLAFGLIYSLKKPHFDHPYGFDRARYVYALISGVTIFNIGAVLTIAHGVNQLYHPSLVLDHSITWAYAVLTFTLIFEGWSLSYAYQQAKIQANMEGLSLSTYVLKGHEPNTIAVLAEDIAATVGVLIAGVGIGLSAYTGNPMYDAIGSIGIGSILGGMAIFIVLRNKDALIGRSMDAAKQNVILGILERQPTVLCVNDVKTMVEGPSYARFKAEIFFDTDALTLQYLKTQDLPKLLTEANSLVTEKQMEIFLKEQNKQLVDIIALEVDRLEGLIKRQYPEIRHVDLEIL